MKFTVFGLMLFVSTSLFAQLDTTKVAFVAYWSIGDVYNFKITKTNQQWKEDKIDKDEKQEYIAKFTVLDSTAKSYTISWTYQNDLESTYEIPEKLREKFSKYNLTEVKYKTSEVGVFLEVLNWKEVGSMMKNMFEDLIVVYGEGDKAKQKKLEQTLKPLKELYSSKQGVEEIVLQELQYLHFPMGLEYDITEPILYDDELPNMFGGDPIKAKASLTFENVDFEEGFCEMKQQRTVNPEDTKDVILQIFARMKIDEKVMNEALKTAVISIVDNNRFDYYFNPGIPEKIEIVRETTIDISDAKTKKIERTVIEMVSNE